MPLIVGDIRDLEEQPLAGLVLERGLVELDFDRVCVMLATGNLVERMAVAAYHRGA